MGAAAPAIANDEIQARRIMVMTLVGTMIVAQRRFLELRFISVSCGTNVLDAVASGLADPCFFLV